MDKGKTGNHELKIGEAMEKCWSCGEEKDATPCPQCGAGDFIPKPIKEDVEMAKKKTKKTKSAQTTKKGK